MNKIQKEIERLTGPELEKEVRMIEEESEQIVVFEVVDPQEVLNRIMSGVKRKVLAEQIQKNRQSTFKRLLNWITKKDELF